MSWKVDDETNPGSWTYAYNFLVTEKDISHIMIEVSEDFTKDNITEISSPASVDGYFDEDDPTPRLYTAANGNPGMLDAGLFGIKWDNLVTKSYDFWIVSNRVPMWGDFYAKDGKVDGNDVYAYNTGFGTETTAAIGDGNAGGWVLVPDTHEVPIPPTIFLFGCSLIGLAVVRRKKIQ